MITCQECRWFDRDPGEPLGRCRLHPPTVHLLGIDELASVWPAVGPEDGCSQGRLDGLRLADLVKLEKEKQGGKEGS